jgi:hypothetical protein
MQEMRAKVDDKVLRIALIWLGIEPMHDLVSHRIQFQVRGDVEGSDEAVPRHQRHLLWEAETPKVVVGS